MANQPEDNAQVPPRAPATAPESPFPPSAQATPTSPADGAPAHNGTPEAKRALAEAEARRCRLAQNDTGRAAEIGGRDGPDPTRYGDWEKGGIASDF